MWRKKEKSKSIRINTKPKSSSFKIISSRKIILYKSVRIPKKLYNKHQKKIVFMTFQMFQMVM